MCLVQIKSKGRCFQDKQACFDALSELNKSEDLKDIKHLLHKLIEEWDCKTIKEFSVKIVTELNTFSATIKCKSQIEVKPDYILKSQEYIKVMIQKYKRSKALSLRNDLISVDDFTDNKICFEKDLASDSESGEEEQESLDSDDE